MKITKQQLQQIIKEEMEAELSEDKYATEDDRPLGTSRSLLSDKDAREALKTAEMLYKEIGTDPTVSAAARAFAIDSPIPRAPPVTSATFPCSRPLILMSPVQQNHQAHRKPYFHIPVRSCGLES